MAEALFACAALAGEPAEKRPESESAVCRSVVQERAMSLVRGFVEFKEGVLCAKCHRPIVSGEGLGFVSFKIPGQEGYQFFHRRSPGEDCWEAYVREKR